MVQPLLGGRLVSNVFMGYTDANSGAHLNFSSCAVSGLPDDQEWFVPGLLGIGGDYGQAGPAQMLILCSHPDYRGSAMVAATQFNYVWGKSGNTATYKTIAPAGYTALSDYFSMNLGPTIPGGSYISIGCVTNAAVVPATIKEQLWNDHGTHANDSGSIWAIDDETSAPWYPFVAVSGYDQPAAAWKVNMDLVEMI